MDEKPLTLFIGTWRAAEHWAKEQGWTREDVQKRLIHYLRIERLDGRTESIAIVRSEQDLGYKDWLVAQEAAMLVELSNARQIKKEK